PSHSQPSAAALMSGQFLLTSGEGQVYSEQEADEWLAQTRWKKLERKTLAGPASCIIAEATQVGDRLIRMSHSRAKKPLLLGIISPGRSSSTVVRLVPQARHPQAGFIARQLTRPSARL